MLRWNRSLAVGIAEIDKQHKALLERAERFEAAVQSRAPSYQLGDLFDYLKAYVHTHFDAEEQLMRKISYPGLDEHIQGHADFRQRLESLVPHWDSEGESPALLMAVLGLLDRWVSEHVAGADQRLADFMRGRD
jgi:hemerythrin